jgi:hypothetical protein
MAINTSDQTRSQGDLARCRSPTSDAAALGRMQVVGLLSRSPFSHGFCAIAGPSMAIMAMHIRRRALERRSYRIDLFF